MEVKPEHNPDPLAVPCPTCGAQPTRGCTSVLDNRQATTTHNLRLRSVLLTDRQWEQILAGIAFRCTSCARFVRGKPREICGACS